MSRSSTSSSSNTHRLLHHLLKKEGFVLYEEPAPPPERCNVEGGTTTSTDAAAANNSNTPSTLLNEGTTLCEVCCKEVAGSSRDSSHWAMHVKGREHQINLQRDELCKAKVAQHAVRPSSLSSQEESGVASSAVLPQGKNSQEGGGGAAAAAAGVVTASQWPCVMLSVAGSPASPVVARGGGSASSSSPSAPFRVASWRLCAPQELSIARTWWLETVESVRDVQQTMFATVAAQLHATQSQLIVLLHVEATSAKECVRKLNQQMPNLVWEKERMAPTPAAAVSSSSSSSYPYSADIMCVVGLQKARFSKVASQVVSLVNLVASRCHSEPFYQQAFVSSRMNSDQIMACFIVLHDSQAQRYLLVAAVESTLSPDYERMRACAVLELQRMVGLWVKRMEEVCHVPVGRIYLGDFGSQPSSLLYSYLTSLSVSSTTFHKLTLSDVRSVPRGSEGGGVVMVKGKEEEGEAGGAQLWKEVRFRAQWHTTIQFPGELRLLRAIGLGSEHPEEQRELRMYLSHLQQMARTRLLPPTASSQQQKANKNNNKEEGLSEVGGDDDQHATTVVETYEAPEHPSFLAFHNDPLVCHVTSWQMLLDSDSVTSTEVLWTAPAPLTLHPLQQQQQQQASLSLLARCPAKPGTQCQTLTRCGSVEWTEWHRAIPSPPTTTTGGGEAATETSLLAPFFVVEALSYGVGEATVPSSSHLHGAVDCRMRSAYSQYNELLRAAGRTPQVQPQADPLLQGWKETLLRSFVSFPFVMGGGGGEGTIGQLLRELTPLEKEASSSSTTVVKQRAPLSFGASAPVQDWLEAHYDSPAVRAKNCCEGGGVVEPLFTHVYPVPSAQRAPLLSHREIKPQAPWADRRLLQQSYGFRFGTTAYLLYDARWFALQGLLELPNTEQVGKASLSAGGGLPSRDGRFPSSDVLLCAELRWL